MLEVADIVRLHGAAYREQFGAQLSSPQKRALHDIENCRTPFFGGHVYQCDGCSEKVYSYHSCSNRHCPKCHSTHTQRWLDQQKSRMLACAYYQVTFTLPSELRPLARSHPKTVYGLLMKAAAEALLKILRDPRYLGARPGCLAVLHTWTRAMLFHPHVHMLVTAGGLSSDGRWIPPRHPRFLVPEKPLAQIFRAKLCAALKKAGLLAKVPAHVWKKDWVVDSQHAGRGEAVLRYLARYLFRVAIANSRLERIQDGQVRFRYRDNRTQQIRHCTLSGVEFLHRFLQHVLPSRCSKVRYYGIWSPRCRSQLDLARTQFDTPAPALLSEPLETEPLPSPPRCPRCRSGNLVLIGVLAPQRSRSP